MISEGLFDAMSASQGGTNVGTHEVPAILGLGMTHLDRLMDVQNRKVCPRRIVACVVCPMKPRLEISALCPTPTNSSLPG
jgi:hypothetical protein